MDDGYGNAFEKIQNTLSDLGGEGVATTQILSALADLTVMLGVIVEGEQGAYAMLDRMKGSVVLYKGGLDPLPQPDEFNNEDIASLRARHGRAH